MKKLALALALLGSLSCVTHRPGWVYNGEYCIATVPACWDTLLARAIAMTADSIVPLVAEMLRLPVARNVDVHVLETGSFDDKKAILSRFTSPPPTIELSFLCFDEADRLKKLLAHEIVHHYMAGAGWSDFPCVLEEVMAEFVVGSLNGVAEDQILSKATSTTRCELERAFALSDKDLKILATEEGVHLYRICFEFIRRVGWCRTVNMLHEGRASRAELLAAYEGATTEHGMTTR
jgi:hypothetical protein